MVDSSRDSIIVKTIECLELHYFVLLSWKSLKANVNSPRVGLYFVSLSTTL